MATRTKSGPGRIREFFTGVSFLFRGFGVWRTAPGLMVLGLIPAVIVAALFTAGVIALGLNLQQIATAVTPFANEWVEPWRGGIRLVAALAFLAAAYLLIVNTFTTITLIVGQPFYERIWRHVEDRAGGIRQEASTGFWRSAGRGIADGLRMLVPTLLVGLALFLLGFVPVAGTALTAVLGAFVGGWYLTVELTALPFDSRGVRLRDRRAALRGRRALAQGFGVVTYLLFLVPLGAVVVMPAAVAGATLLSRRILGEAVSAPTRTPS